MASLDQSGNTITLSGALDVDGACELYSASLQFGADTVFVDISSIDDLDTAGLALLVHWRQQASKQDSRLVVIGAQERAANLARMYGLGAMLAGEGSGANPDG